MLTEVGATAAAAGESPLFVLLTCEHGGRDVPAAYRRVFRGQKALLSTHRGYDIGALGVATRMASLLAAPLIFSTVTRLLIDLNRSLDQRDVFSEFTRDLDEAERASIVATYYRPHRDSVERTVAAATAGGHRVVHVGIHSCTDVLKGSRRELELALLFDEARPLEAVFCERWRDELARIAPDRRCPFNQPYRGSDDGLTTSLRGRFSADDYLGLEVEVRQGIIGRAVEQRVIGELLAQSLRSVCRPTA